MRICRFIVVLVLYAVTLLSACCVFMALSELNFVAAFGYGVGTIFTGSGLRLTLASWFLDE